VDQHRLDLTFRCEITQLFKAGTNQTRATEPFVLDNAVFSTAVS
jgi:hypothetical protein